MEIKKVYKELLPQVRLVGKRFVKQNMSEGGSFANCWQQAFQENWFDMLRDCKGIPGISEDLCG